ncbi:MAG: GMC family oxidoreductase [Pseudomonadota bacterium]|nr:GMC family oxidoreductase [Pseudomonadota bacterium]
MFANLSDLGETKQISCDLCIVGGGAAGITIAREMIGSPLSVCLVESAEEYHQPTQDLYQATQQSRKRSRSLETGVHYGATAHLSRIRHFGGTTNHWGGYCIPLTPHDLAKKDWMPDSGWPIEWEELNAFYPRAQAICGAGPFVYDERLWDTTSRKSYAFDPDYIVNRFFQFSPPIRFGDKYGDDLKSAANINVLFDANAVKIGLQSNTKSADHIAVRSLKGKTAHIRARHYIIACGGMENARLLLDSNDVTSDGVGNSRGLVGRYFMDHLYDTIGALLVSERPQKILDQYAETVPDKPSHPLAGKEPTMFQPIFSASEAAQNRNKAGGVIVMLRGEWARPDEGIDAVYQAIHDQNREVTGEYGDHLLDILFNLDTSLTEMKSYMQGKHPDHMPVLFAIAEQAPNRDSRITLSDQRDALGRPRAHIDWQLSETDLRTFAQMPRLLAREFGRLGIGRVHVSPWLDEDAIYLYRKDFSRVLEPGRHHSGTTRMASDPAKGVVNAECRLFDVENISIAGSSVFPTIGYANPTLTIVALALRLAEHLKKQLA